MSAILNGAKPQNASGWEEKYHSCLQELEKKGQQWQQDESQLTKVILRLAFSYIGFNSELDQLLARLGDTLRNNKSPKDRRKLIKNLVDDIANQVEKLDLSKKTRKESQALLLKLLAKLELREQQQDDITEIKNKLERHANAEAIDSCVQYLATIINDLTEASVEEFESGHNNQNAADIKDGFNDFLHCLSLPDENNIDISTIQKRAEKIESRKQQLELIEDTARLLSELLRNTPDNTRTIASSAENSLNETLLQLLEWISFPAGYDKKIKALKKKLNKPLTADQTSGVLREFSELVTQVNQKLQSELDDMGKYLNQILGQLKELSSQLIETGIIQSGTYTDTITLNEQITHGVNEIKKDIENGSDLKQIKSDLKTHLKGIQDNLDSYLETEKVRQKKSELKFNDLNQRLQQMESQTVELKTAVEKERLKSQIDALTGIANRLAYEEIMQHEFTRWQRHGTELSLALIDIDNFKRINDDYGHLAGDKVLKTIAELCAKHTRSIDFLARYGGEEFVMIFPDTAKNEAHSAAEHLRRKVEQCNFNYDSKRVPVTISIGISQFLQGDDTEDVFKRADKALYKAKQSGRNLCLADDEQEENPA